MFLLQGLVSACIKFVLYIQFFNIKPKIDVKLIRLFISILLMSTLYSHFKDQMPHFLALASYPILFVIVLHVIEKKSFLHLSAYVTYTSLVTILVELVTTLLLLSFDQNSFIINHTYYYVMLIAPLELVLTYLLHSNLRKQQRYVMSLKISSQERYFSVFIIMHIAYLTEKYIVTDYTLRGYQSSEIFLLFLGIVMIYLSGSLGLSIWHIKKNTYSNVAFLYDESIHLKKKILSTSLSIRHDAKNLMYALSPTDEDQLIVNSPIITSLINQKRNKAEKHDIKLVIIDEPYLFTDLQVNELDYAIILGILLDNAIEHVANNELAPIVNLTLHPHVTRIKNPLACNSQVEKFTELHYSSKTTEHSGYGLYNATRLCNSNKLNLHIEALDDHCLVSIKHPII